MNIYEIVNRYIESTQNNNSICFNSNLNMENIENMENIVNMILYLTFIYPILEYYIHYLLHKFDNLRHKEHHLQYHSSIIKGKDLIETETWPIFFIIISIYFNMKYILVGLIYYSINHTLIHKMPYCTPLITHHHLIHHKYNNCNYCVSNIWPDILFGTYKS